MVRIISVLAKLVIHFRLSLGSVRELFNTLLNTLTVATNVYGIHSISLYANYSTSKKSSMIYAYYFFRSFAVKNHLQVWLFPGSVVF